MNRKEFISKSILAGTAGVVVPGMLKASNVKLKNSDYDKFIDQVGFNHLPNNEIKTMNTVLHKANTRGHANHGWLDSHHSFSFANYHNPQRMNFGVLRVLNDDKVAKAKGFGTHPHDNMEIISIPLKGDLEHKDSIGNVAIIKEGDVQVLSAGTGIFHSEFNKSQDEEVQFLQIWMFPNEKQVNPRYDQISLSSIEKDNELYQILSPSKEDQGVWVHQNSWFNLGKFNEKTDLSYPLKDKKNGVYAFVLEGQVKIQNQMLNKRDGFGIWNTDSINITAEKDSRILLMEVPMKL